MSFEQNSASIARFVKLFQKNEELARRTREIEKELTKKNKRGNQCLPS